MFPLYNKSFGLIFLLFVFVVCLAISIFSYSRINGVVILAKPRSLNFDAYLHEDDLTELFNELATQFPSYAKVGSIGLSVRGRTLQYLELTENVHIDSPGRPMVKYVANMHGDETVGRELIIALCKHLLYSYTQESRSHSILKNMRIFLMPSMNPDGFEASKEGVCGTTHRNNANGKDLNRNFPDQFDSEEMTQQRKFEPETQAMIDWITSNKFVLSLNFHGGAVVASYPYDDSVQHRPKVYSRAPDDDFFKLMAHTYADAHTTMHNNKTTCRGDFFPGGVTNGAYWYDIRGGMQDYNYIHGDCMEITIELSCCKYPNALELHEEWEKNKEALLQTLELANRGVRGFIKDKITGEPVSDALIKIEGIGKDMKSDSHGAYWRLLVPGQYVLSVVKSGYIDSDPIQVVIGAEDYVVKNVDLLPVSRTGRNTAPTNSTPLAHSQATKSISNTPTSSPTEDLDWILYSKLFIATITVSALIAFVFTLFAVKCFCVLSKKFISKKKGVQRKLELTSDQFDETFTTLSRDCPDESSINEENIVV